ncbi:hypothetical protein J2S09_000246 [Bacillus fengqiuensis]|nr:hypothetical protein [Bacillus fengqiuensis]
MDIAAIGITAVMFALFYGFIMFCDKILQD